MDRKTHWEGIYGTKGAKAVSWFALHLSASLRFIMGTGIKISDPILDVGAGASTLVDDLLHEGFTDVSLMDISAEALALAKARLAHKASQIHWIEEDVANAHLPKNKYALWHDRAVFHFLTDAQDRKKYRQLLSDSLQRKGYAVIATFSLEGPPKCSGLNVVRYSPETLAKELGPDFTLLQSATEDHKTPFETIQKFVYCLFQRV